MNCVNVIVNKKLPSATSKQRISNTTKLNHFFWYKYLLSLIFFSCCLSSVFADKNGNFGVEDGFLEKDLKDILAEIVMDQERITKALSATEIGNARTTIKLCSDRLGYYKKQIDRDTRNESGLLLKGYTARALFLEDSLVKVSLEIIKSDGHEAGITFLQKDLAKTGVSLEAQYKIEEAILHAKDALPSKEDAEILRNARGEFESGRDLNMIKNPHVRAVALRMQQIHIDSINVAKALADSLEVVRLEKMRADSLMRIEQAKLDELRRKTKVFANHLYSLLDEKKIVEAWRSFKEKELRLKKIMTPQSFVELKTKVTEAHRAFQAYLDAERKKYKIRATELLTKINAELKQGSIAIAYDIYTNNISVLSKGLPVMRYDNLTTRVTTTYKLMREEEDLRMRKKAKELALKLYTLIGEQKVSEAYNRFNNISDKLKRYMVESEYLALERLVRSSYKRKKR